MNKVQVNNMTTPSPATDKMTDTGFASNEHHHW